MNELSTFPPTILSHVSLGTNCFEKAKKFYDAVMAALEVKCLCLYPGAAAYGRKFS